MIVLLAFAVLAGAATAITPCVLPVLPGAAVRQRQRRAAAPGRRRLRARAHPHDRDRRDRVGRRRRRLRRRHAAHAGDRRAARLRADAARAGREPLDRGADGGAVALRAAPGRHGVLVGPRRRRGARLRLRAVRGPDPRRRHLGERVARDDRRARRGRGRVRRRLGRRAARDRARRAARARARAARPARPGRAARVRRRDGADRRPDVREPRHPLSERARKRVPRLPDQPDRHHRALAPGPGPPRRAARRVEVPGADGAQGRAEALRGPRLRRRLPGVQTPDLPVLGDAPEFADTGGGSTRRR